MNSYNPNEPLISIHIPKCAGSSFSSVLKKWFKRNYLPHYHKEKTNTQPRKHKLGRGFLRKRRRCDLCIHGHFNNNRKNGVRDYYPEVNQFITVIRDPFDLHVSTYFYVKREANAGGAGALRSGKPHPIIANGWNLEQFLEYKKRSYILNFLPSEITEDNYELILSSQFLHIGITEHLQATVDQLASILGYDTVSVPESNVSSWTEAIPKGAREEFASNNQLEFAIYNYAHNRWFNNYPLNPQKLER